MRFTENSRRHSPRLSPRGIKLCALLLASALLLTACAAAPTLAPPQRQPAIPETVAESDSGNASGFSARAQDWLRRVQDYLSE